MSKLEVMISSENGEVVARTPAEVREAAEQQAPKAPASGLSSRVHRGGTSSVVISSRTGDMTHSSTGRASGTTADIVDEKKALAPGSVLMSARSPGGRPLGVAEVTANSLVEYQGMQITAKVAASMGILDQTESGQYVDMQDAREALPEDANEAYQPAAEVTLSPAIVTVANAAIAGLPSTLGHQILMNTLTGKAGDADFIRAAELTGQSMDSLVGNIDAAVAGLGTFMGDQLSVSLEDLPDVLFQLEEFDAKGLQDAYRHIISGSDGTKFVELAERFITQLPVDMDELVSDGLQVKRQGGVDLVLVADEADNESWIDVRVARRMGFV